MSAKKTKMDNYVKKTFGGKVRIRVSGILYQEDKILILKHKIDNYFLWAPPGGGVEFGATIEETLLREFKEETGLVIKVAEFLFLTEHIKAPLHAIELFYHVTSENYNITLGKDPEVEDYSILQDIRFVDGKELSTFKKEELHTSLKSCTNPIELLDKRGQLN